MMIEKRKIFIVITGLLLLTFSWASYATTLEGNISVDNGFYLYISTDDNSQGNYVGEGNNWETTYSFNYVLTPGNTYYIHLKGLDWGFQNGFLGEFSLGDALFKFQNGSQTLLTDTDNWYVNSTGFGDPYFTPISYGSNGVSPWGTRPGISSSALWIWEANAPDTVYFSTSITPVPEPSTLLLLGSLLTGLAGIRKLKVKTS